MVPFFRRLSLSLSKSEENVVVHTKTKTSSHNLFSHINDVGVRFDLIKNRSEAFLAKELAHADYFLKIEGDLDDKSNFISKLKSTKGVLAVFELDVEELKSKENFIF